MARWLGHKMQELKIPAASCQPVYQWAANFEGPGFVQITEDEFKARLPQVRFFFTFVSFIPCFLLLVFGILGHFSCMIFFPVFCLAHLALQNVNKDYVIFSYFRNFVAKSDQKPKTKNGMNEVF